MTAQRSPDPVRRIADAVLYEGYVLWPYGRSSLKNQRRWTFGGVYPRAHSQGRDDDPWTMRTGCLLEVERDDASVDVRVRFLQVVQRDVARATPAGPELVDALSVGERRHLAWEEAVERELGSGPLDLERLLAGQRLRIDIAAGREEEPVAGPQGAPAGALIRSWEPLRGAIDIAGERLGDALLRVAVTIANRTPWDGGPRQDVLRRTFCSTHTVLRASGASFVSQTDPPERLREAAQDCRNEGTWPVLVGEPGARDTLLSSPIILEDHPRIAPESPGALFDGGEIEQLLTLSILSLTDEEKAEMRDADPRTREILERTEGLSDEQLARLHAEVRDLRAVRER